MIESEAPLLFGHQVSSVCNAVLSIQTKPVLLQVLALSSLPS